MTFSPGSRHDHVKSSSTSNLHPIPLADWAIEETMNADDNMNEAIIQLWHEFKEWPPQAHLFCPKLNDDDCTNYDQPNVPDEDGVTVEEKHRRIEASMQRHVNAYNLSLLMGIPPEEAGDWLREWTDTVEKYLTTCDSCAREWHKSRERFLKGLESYVS